MHTIRHNNVTVIVNKISHYSCAWASKEVKPELRLVMDNQKVVNFVLKDDEELRGMLIHLEEQLETAGETRLD